MRVLQANGFHMVGHDKHTEHYFEKNTPAYSLGRYQEVVAFLRDDAPAGASLLDIGCGSGNVLKLIAENSPIDDIAGIDVSSAYLDQCAQAVPGCQTCLSSILDPSLQVTIGRQFRYVLVGAVLHHLVGNSRKESLGYAREGLAGAWSLVDAGGRAHPHGADFLPSLGDEHAVPCEAPCK